MSSTYHLPGVLVSTLHRLTHLNLTAALGGQHSQHSHFLGHEIEAQGGEVAC